MDWGERRARLSARPIRPPMELQNAILLEGQGAKCNFANGGLSEWDYPNILQSNCLGVVASWAETWHIICFLLCGTARIQCKRRT